MEVSLSWVEFWSIIRLILSLNATYFSAFCGSSRPAGASSWPLSSFGSSTPPETRWSSRPRSPTRPSSSRKPSDKFLLRSNPLILILWRCLTYYPTSLGCCTQLNSLAIFPPLLSPYLLQIPTNNCVVAVLRIVNGAKNWEAGLVGGLLRWNRPLT